MLARLPPELLCHIYTFLPPTSVNQISLTCHDLYTSALPSLYSTIVLSFRKHIRQLETGLQRKESFLHHVMRHHTKEVLLKCKQGGQHRLTFDIRSLLRQLPHIRTLTLVDFHMLPINFITPLLSLLPHLEQVSLRYCDLVSTSPTFSSSSSSFLNDGTNNNNNNNNNSLSTSSSSLTSLELFWTDFPKAAVEALLSALPRLTKVRLLANHNRHYMANNYALVSLLHYCRHVKDLDIGLQEVDERTVASSIIAYGEQIQRLSVRCHSPLILDTITKYAPFVRNLIVRFSLDTLWYSSVSTQETLPLSTTGQSRHHQDDQTIDDNETRGQNDGGGGGGGLLHLLSHCQHLERIQVVSMSPTSQPSLPPIVSKALASVTQKRLLRTNPNILIASTITNRTPSTSGSSNQHDSNGIAPTKMATSMDNEDDEMINVATYTTARMSMKASSHHHDLREQRKWNQDMIQEDGDNDHQGNIYSNSNSNSDISVEADGGNSQRRQNPPPIAISATTQMYTLDLQQQSAKEHNRMEASLTLDNEQLNEIRWLASMM